MIRLLLARCNLGCSRRLTGKARFEFSNGGHADENESANVGTSSAIQLSVTDAIASVTLASRVDRGDPESCDDVGDDIPQGNARHNRNPNSHVVIHVL